MIKHGCNLSIGLIGCCLSNRKDKRRPFFCFKKQHGKIRERATSFRFDDSEIRRADSQVRRNALLYEKADKPNTAAWAKYLSDYAMKTYGYLNLIKSLFISYLKCDYR